MLRSLLSAHGVNPQMITVFIDGYYEVIVLLLLHHSEPRWNYLAPKLPLVGSSICFHVFPSGAHGRGGAVWPEGRPAHANQHQERPSVSGMDDMAPPSMATLGTLLLVHSGALPLRNAALQGQSDRHLQPLPRESHAPLLPLPPQHTNRKLKILNYLVNCLFPYFLRTPTLPSSWRKTWMSLSTSLGTRAPFPHHT